MNSGKDGGGRRLGMVVQGTLNRQRRTHGGVAGGEGVAVFAEAREATAGGAGHPREPVGHGTGPLTPGTARRPTRFRRGAVKSKFLAASPPANPHPTLAERFPETAAAMRCPSNRRPAIFRNFGFILPV